MAYRVKLMPRAQRDLAGIYDWIGARSSDPARTWYSGLKDSIRSLRNIPYRCPVTPEDDGLGHLLFGHKPHVYRVIYRVVEEMKQVEVLQNPPRSKGRIRPGGLLPAISATTRLRQWTKCSRGRARLLSNPKVWADAWLLAFARAAKGSLVTFDRALAGCGAQSPLPGT